MLRPAALTILLWNAVDALLACPYCPPSQPTLAEQLAQSDRAALVKWVRLIPARSELDSPQTVFSVVEVERDGRGELKPGSTITADYERQALPGDLFFVLGKLDRDVTQWGLPVEVTEISYAYIRQIPSPEKPAGERLGHFVKFLEASDPLIAADAFAEFSRAKYEDVLRLAPMFSRAKVRNWLQSPKTEKTRLAFYGMLLGLCGEAADAEYLWQKIAPPPVPNEPRLGIDGVMGGYVLLTGAKGLDRLLDAKVRPRDVDTGEAYAVLNTLRFLWEYAPNQVPRANVTAAMRLLLQRPTFAEVAMIDLARWKAWEATPDVLAWFGRDPFNEPKTQAVIVRFAKTCIKDAAAAGTAQPAANQAQSFLDRLRDDDPATWQRIEEMLNPRPRRNPSLESLIDAPPKTP